jgi:hypothetical protein
VAEWGLVGEDKVGFFTFYFLLYLITLVNFVDHVVQYFHDIFHHKSSS